MVLSAARGPHRGPAHRRQRLDRTGNRSRFHMQRRRFIGGPIQTCLISDGGLLVIFPLTMPADVTGVITGSGFAQQYEVPLPAVSGSSLPDPGDLFVIPHDQGSIQVEFYYNDKPSGAAVSGPIGP
jgi:hypothetical protein